ncbi:MAG TPA: ATP-NAD kinase family protein [Cellvibrio sp.]|nr:ATP-NAD kinase family protein [Cellvibrio sp.]
MFRLGIIVNPYAGLGGTVGLKGSDGADTVAEALQRGAEPRAMERMSRALQVLLPWREHLHLFCYAGDMGETCAAALDFIYTRVGTPTAPVTTAFDTCEAARVLMEQGVDLILFAGGDGTARNIADAVGTRQAVLGVPSGVKMHSGVYAITPESAGQIVQLLLEGKLVPIAEQDVKDIDEDAFRAGQVRARLYGTLLVPEAPQFLQQVKHSGAQVDELAQIDVASEVIEQLVDDTLYIIGPGSTTHVLLQQLNLQGSLLGVDLLCNQQLIATDVTAQEIREAINLHTGLVRIIITAIGGQGHIIGRGNQQLTPDILRRVGKENIQVIATREKILALQGRPLLVDSHDPALDKAFAGYLPVITGYRERIMYPVGFPDQAADSASAL